MTDCLFCKIAAGEVDSDIVVNRGDIVAFRDINPAARTHVLVIPKRHIASAADLTDSDGNLLAEIFATINEIATQEGLNGGYRVVTNIGPDAGQSVHHLHFHLIGGRAMDWPPG
ncbi:MAG: histidine triad nucleotide-binding protein [Actinomycetota bacterium]